MKILIADDHAIVRDGLIALLRKEFKDIVIREASNGGDAIEIARSGEWDIIVIDISMPGRNGLEALKQMRAEGLKTPIIILSMHPEDQYAIRALKAGASGYVNKECATAELVAAVHQVLLGKKYISAVVSEKLASSFTDMSGKLAHESLSDREMQVLVLIASGKTLSEVAAEISLGASTISTYRARLLEKLSLNNNAELTRYGMDNALV